MIMGSLMKLRDEINARLVFDSTAQAKEKQKHPGLHYFNAAQNVSSSMKCIVVTMTDRKKDIEAF